MYFNTSKLDIVKARACQGWKSMYKTCLKSRLLSKTVHVEHFFIVYYKEIVYVLNRLTTIMLMSLHTKKWWLSVKFKHYFRRTLWQNIVGSITVLKWFNQVRVLIAKQHFQKAFSQFFKFKDLLEKWLIQVTRLQNWYLLFLW